MRSVLLAAFLLALCSFPSKPAAAQVAGARNAARELLRAEVRQKVVQQDTVSTIRTRNVPEGRVDADGIYRARYRIPDRVPSGLPPAEAAIRHLERSARSYGIGTAEHHLSVESVIDGRYSSHVRLRQTFFGVPVYGRDVAVSLDKNGQPTMVVNGYAPHLELVSDFNPVPSISREQAVRIVQTAGTRGLDVTEPELVVYPSKPPRLAWRMTAEPGTLPVTWEVLLDAATGEIILMLDVTMDASARHGGAGEGERPAMEGESVAAAGAPDGMASSAASLTEAYADAGSVTAESVSTRVEGARIVDGSGLVFDPDPLSSAGVEYGPPYVDSNDDDVPELNAQRFEVTLRDITQGTDGHYRLEGPYVIIDGSSSGYEAPAEASPDGFRYTRANDYFEAVNVYYHIDKSQRYVQSLDVGFPIRERPILANPQASTGDESNYNANNLLRFGTGGIDDGEDADVIWHEYAHALLHDTAPNVPLGDTEGGALHEGFADYWAASYSRYLSEVDEQIPEHNWRELFSWDGNTDEWCGRVLDHPGSYPDDTVYSGSGCPVNDSKYAKGVLWATTMMEIYSHVGRDVLDRLHLASHAYLGSAMSFTDAAQALLQADVDLYGGSHGNILVHYLDERGYIDASQYGPLIAHESLTAMEQTGGTIRIEVTASASAAEVDSVMIFYGWEGALSERFVLEPQGGDLYAGDFPLPDEEATVSYFVEAVDVGGRRRLLPAGAPDETFRFDVGPDHEPPAIVHEPLEQVAAAGWPADVYALVEDNLGVDSVWVEYTLNGAGGAVVEEGAFPLQANGTTFSGRFPVSANKVEGGYAVTYLVAARDESMNGNTAATSPMQIEILEEGVLRAYDFEGINHGAEATGDWQRGAPTYGLRVAHSGSRIWGTVLDGQYSSSPTSSTLTLPALDVAHDGPIYLVFWHWYDFEHNGQADPGRFDPNATLWDGGNVKVWTDAEPTWTVVEPEDGYNGTVSRDYGNPIGGEPAFGGYSYGWRLAVIELPQNSGVRVRFEMGADNSNEQQTEYFAGWYIDDVSVTTQPPIDVRPPVASALPETVTTRITGTGDQPTIRIEAEDDIGIEAVLAASELITVDAVRRDTIRLAMSPTDRSTYSGPVVPRRTFAAGDRIEYRLIVRDFAGHESIYGDPFFVDYRAEQRDRALAGVVASGAWSMQGSTWAALGTTDHGVSSLVLQPYTLPSNADRERLVMEHSFQLGGDLGGNVKISHDDGATWHVLEPAAGYGATFAPPEDHPMSGQAVFQGTSGGSTITAFDLSDYAGSEIRIRIDLAKAGASEAGEGWFVHEAAFQSLTPESEFETERTLTLHANFPDPFADRTNITYTVPERAHVRLAVYDLLGRRVSLLLHAEQDEGTYSISFGAEGLASGVYMLYLETPSGTRTERMVVAR